MNRKWALRFLLSPTSFESDLSNPEYLGSVNFKRTVYRDPDIFAPDARVRPTEEVYSSTASIAFRSVGYKSEPIPGLEDIGVVFDHDLGIIPNDVYGRVINPNIGPGPQTAGHVPGLYCAGWVKRGPTGVIASTMEDAFTTADIIAKDWEERVPFFHREQDGIHRSGWDGLKQAVYGVGLRPVDWHGWKRIDNYEKDKGKLLGKEREKVTSVVDMLKILDS